jgi:hypothetical protein
MTASRVSLSLVVVPECSNTGWVPLPAVLQDILEERWCVRTGTQVREQTAVEPAVSSHIAAMKQQQDLISRVAGAGLLWQHR